MHRAVALILVAAGMLSLGACSSTIAPGPIPTPTKTQTASFSLADQEALSSALSASRAQHGWAGGCLWPAGTTRPLTDALHQMDVVTTSGFRFSRQQGPSGAIIVVVVRDARGSTSGSSDEVSGPDFLCYRPEEVLPPHASA